MCLVSFQINHVCRKRSVSLSSVMTPTHHDDDEGKKVTLFDSKALILQFNNLSVTPRTLSLTTLCTKSDQSLVLDDKRPECLGRKSSSDASSTGILKRKAVVKHWKFKAKFGFKHKPKKLVLQPAKFKFLKRDSESIVRDFTNDLATELDIILNVSVSKQSSCRVKSARQPTTNYKVGGRKGRPSVDHKELFENISTQVGTIQLYKFTFASLDLYFYAFVAQFRNVERHRLALSRLVYLPHKMRCL